MKIILRHLHHEPSASLTAQVESELEALNPLLQIDEARVLIEHRSEVSPAFHVALHLVTPGPDLLAESTDHTLRAAVRKAFASLGNKLGQRTQNRLRRTSARSGRRTAFRH